MAIPQAQELREKIVFQTATGAKNIRGGRVTLVTYATAWARITEGGGGIETETQAVQAQVQSFEIWTRWIEGVTGFMQILWGSRILVQTEPPQKVIDSRNRQWWLITAEEKTEGD